MSQYKGKPNDQCFKGGSCGILENRLFVLPDGKVTLCEQLYWHPQFILGDLKEQTLAEIWQSPRAKALFEWDKLSFGKIVPARNVTFLSFVERTTDDA